MKSFFKMAFASMVGMLFSFFAILLIFILVVMAVASKTDEEVEVKANSVLHIPLDYPVVERGHDDPFSKLDINAFGKSKSVGLNDVLAAIRRAKTDDNIKGIYLDLSSLQAGYATLEEIRNELLNFKRSKKFILAYSEVYTKNSYYLASVADKVYLNPEGIVEFTGFSSQLMFFKGSLEKLGIEPQIIKVGTYKSAVEPFILDRMSDPNRQQVTSFLGSLYDHYLSLIATARKIQKDSLFAIADQLKVRSPKDAVAFKLVDALRYKDEVLDELKSRSGIEKDKDVKSVTLTDYIKNNETEDGDYNTRIAIVYASGEITGGEGNDETIGSEKISKAIRKARMDDKVKALVLRVNSPGGSALASDVIWREVVLTKKVKPVVVSMGDLAASGGYYISCAADSIFAQPNTITGSIGVFGIIPNMQNFFNNKLGITFDGVKTGTHADLGTITRPLTPEEKLIIQNEVNRIYDSFTKRVAEGRKKTQQYVNEIGQGRVWSGSEALKIGLIDRLGNIDDAVRSAAKMAKVTDYRIVSYPVQKEGLSALFDKSGDKLRVYFAKKELGDQYEYYEKLKAAVNLKGIQTRMPFDISLQ
ncbi:signal peptide peptidase SppA [Desertivirga arenae]|uniref:signal peptide peptidase SppA n=1 Tax=Desertivirga arenae TaxID=2810309 RepID=UPI001A957FD6|nr:signal peptide peptidase SppA [Pedobacter sp. SYSU D00823]